MRRPDVHSSNATIDNGVSGTCTIRFRMSLLTRQANGSALACLDDDTTVFAATTASKAPKERFDFFPLTVDIKERPYATGRIPGSFFRHGGRPGTEVILATRLADRPLYPIFKRDMRNKVQVVAMVMTIDPGETYDVLATNAASTATSLAGLPLLGPIDGTRMALVDRQWVVFLQWSELKRTAFSMTIASCVVGDDIAIMMVETQAPEHMDAVIEVGDTKSIEAEVAADMEAAKPVIRTLCGAQSKLVKKCGKPVGNFPFFPGYADKQYKTVEGKIGGRFTPILGIMARVERDEALNEPTEPVVEELMEAFPEEEAATVATVNAAFRKTMRHHAFTEGVRMSGRTSVRIRTITAEMGVFPRVHGSALFQCGETQILGVTTLDMLRTEQQFDGLSPATSRRYIHHYNLPSYSAGETGCVDSPKRREIGHRHLAETALESQFPDREEFSYTIRQVSETMGSNGSSSMGSVCASTLSLYNVDVPLKAPVVGIAMDLVSATIDGETKYCTLIDILDAEGTSGDMGFKVAGIREYATALRLDTRPDGTPAAVLDATLDQARGARFAILDLVTETIGGPSEMAATASRIIAVKIPVDKIGEVIGPKGKMINQIQEGTGAEISTEGSGTVSIGATDGPSAEVARQAVNAIANPQMPEVGEYFVGTVVKATAFGAFIFLALGRDGLLHISQIRWIVGDKRIGNVGDVLNVGGRVEVGITETDPRGKVSLHAAVKEESETPAEQEETERPIRRECESHRAPRQRHHSSESSGSTERCGGRSGGNCSGNNSSNGGRCKRVVPMGPPFLCRAAPSAHS